MNGGARVVAVTGATGFIGAHLVERLVLGTAYRVRAMTRSPDRVARIAQLDPDRMEIVAADLAAPAGLDARALAGVDVAVHCAYGNDGGEERAWTVTVEGTRAVTQAAVAAGVRRLVHISTVAVYDAAGRARLDERCPRLAPTPGRRGYAEAKLAAEEIVLACSGALEVVVLQPTVVYGPWGGDWSRRALERLERDNAWLPTGGAGVCNAVFVDDVVEAIALSLTAPAAPSSCLLVSGAEPVTWGAFYDALRRMLRVPVPDGCDGPSGLEPWERDLYASSAAVDIERARTLLGYAPAYDLDRGMAALQAWAEWARLTPAGAAPLPEAAR
jgi:nucleoside-diphosphate-sugar epimerase